MMALRFRFRYLFSVVATCGLAVALSLAEEAATGPLAAPKKTEPAQPESAKRTRAISPEVAAQLAAMAPKYEDVPAKPAPAPPPKPVEELPDLRDVDKPKNTIIRLPKYIVQERKPAVLSEKAVNTDKGITEIAMRRYISDADRGLNRFTIPLFAPISTTPGTTTEQRALAMYAEDERLKNMADMNDAAHMVGRSDAAQGTYILRESQKTYMRTNDFGWNGGSPK